FGEPAHRRTHPADQARDPPAEQDRKQRQHERNDADQPAEGLPERVGPALREFGTDVGGVRDLDQRRPGAVENLAEVVELVVERLARNQEAGESKLVGVGETEQFSLHVRGEGGCRQRGLELVLALVELVAEPLFATQCEILFKPAHCQQQDGEARLIDLCNPGFELLDRAAQLALQAVCRG
ncbi:hypothetical protein chiPu_0033151, partial [Chiloscyllium punctatum]|nr:hypothetical protein [Chiloscyllium punctatum]